MGARAKELRWGSAMQAGRGGRGRVRRSRRGRARHRQRMARGALLLSACGGEGDREQGFGRHGRQGVGAGGRTSEGSERRETGIRRDGRWGRALAAEEGREGEIERREDGLGLGGAPTGPRPGRLGWATEKDGPAWADCWRRPCCGQQEAQVAG